MSHYERELQESSKRIDGGMLLLFHASLAWDCNLKDILIFRSYFHRRRRISRPTWLESSKILVTVVLGYSSSYYPALIEINGSRVSVTSFADEFIPV